MDNEQSFGFGQAATEEEIAGWDIDIEPDGTGLPPGSATVEDGKRVYGTYGAPFHGPNGEGTDAGPRLVGGMGTLDTDEPVKTVGSYWPYATTIFDYIRRAMPASAPQTLSNDEYYALTAWVLWANGIITEDQVIDQDTLPTIVMPNRDGFTSPDLRPDVDNSAD
jgi:cytochrome c